MRLRSPLAALSIAALVGCAHDPNADLMRAEAEYRDAASDPFVAEHAPLSLEDARRALEEGRRAERRGESEEEIDHLAYVASRRVEIARFAAERHADVERAEGLAGADVPLPPSAEAISAAFFEPERAELSDASRRDVGRLADLVASRPERWVRIEGHADETERDGLRLSEERASEVADALVERGVDPARLSIRGYGATDPVASSGTAAERQRNRRVDIVFFPLVGAR